jgi:hypothetical protein
MPRFLIEVPHGSEETECARAAKILIQSGSHFLTHADFGCKDGVHKAWIVVEMDDRTEARNLLHPAYRTAATITALNKFSMEELDELLSYHEG